MKSLQALDADSKDDLVKTLTLIIESFVPTWNHYNGWKALLEHVNTFDGELGKEGKPENKGEDAISHKLPEWVLLY